MATVGDEEQLGEEHAASKWSGEAVEGEKSVEEKVGERLPRSRGTVVRQQSNRETAAVRREWRMVVLQPKEEHIEEDGGQSRSSWRRETQPGDVQSEEIVDSVVVVGGGLLLDNDRVLRGWCRDLARGQRRR